MRNVFWTLLATILFVSPCCAAESEEFDWLDLANGAVVLSATSEYDQTLWSALSLVDGTTAAGWATENGNVEPHTFVIELARNVRLRSLAIDDRGVDGAGRGARRIELWGASDSADGTYRLLASGEAQDDARTAFDIDDNDGVRWLKLVAQDNWGDANYIEIMELEAYGEAVGDPPPLRDISGVYDTNYGLMRVVQSGNLATGCYDWDHGTLSSDADGRVLRFQWYEINPIQEGTAIMVLTSDGSRLNGL